MKSLASGTALLGTLAMAGCAVPTDAPMVEQRWIVPLDNTGMSTEALLPEGVAIGGDLFTIHVDPFTSEGTLADLCPSCVAGPGPVPAFDGTFGGTQDLPLDVVGATLERGTVSVAIQNGFSFDPTQGGGSVVITVTDGPGGRMLGQTTISSGLAPGSTVTRGIVVIGGSVRPQIMASAEVRSLGGQTATVDTGAKLSMSVDVTSLEAGFTTVQVAGRAVALDPADLDVADIDDSISDRIESGGLELTINNPFGVAMTLTLVIEYPGGSLARPVVVESAAVSNSSLSYTADEFRSFLGKEGVTLIGPGVISNEEDPITVRTDERLTIDFTLDLTLVVG